MVVDRSRHDVPASLVLKYEASPSRQLILQALEDIEMPQSKRGNVRQRGDTGDIRGMCLGMTESWFHGPLPSRNTRERPNLARLLCAFARHELPSFRFTSIQVNKDYAAELHVDKYDAGDSRIIGLGDYTGGQLWVDDGGHGGRGRVANLHGRWLGFDGNLPHKVLPFKGRRYTLVYFSKIRGCDVGATSSEHARFLLDLGFPLPQQAPRCLQYPSGEERLRVARKRFELFCAHTLRRGGAGRRVRLKLSLPGSELPATAVLSGTTPVKRLGAAVAGLECGQMQLRAGSLPLLGSDRLTCLGLSSGSALTCSSPAPRLGREEATHGTHLPSTPPRKRQRTGSPLTPSPLRRGGTTPSTSGEEPPVSKIMAV
eukprot:TRINITY_DN11155_c0_g1_i1.p1 TRINITY_DN11155_c0_g1~~TRINITY_DN11155_c0_g1_i1.p1  ORF type:complete len:371 (-),score=51.23 TRINITY_DN11155_c0_g1_i1:22-1134(-)